MNTLGGHLVIAFAEGLLYLLHSPEYPPPRIMSITILYIDMLIVVIQRHIWVAFHLALSTTFFSEYINAKRDIVFVLAINIVYSIRACCHMGFSQSQFYLVLVFVHDWMFLFSVVFRCRSYLLLGAVDESHPLTTEEALMSMPFTVFYTRPVKHSHTYQQYPSSVQQIRTNKLCHRFLREHDIYSRVCV